MTKKNEIKNSIENLDYKESENNPKDLSNVGKKLNIE